MKRCGQLKYGCISCRTGCEDRLTREISEKYQDMRVIFPKKKRVRRMGGTAIEEETGLFPGYVFFSTRAEELDLRDIFLKDYAYKLLKNPDGDWPLRGSDRRFAEMVFAEGGVIGFSRAFYEGDRIRVAEGFLKNYEGNIVRLNKRAKTAEIQIELHGRIVTMWLGYELLEADEPAAAEEK